jgi:ankyrin repeat protein
MYIRLIFSLLSLVCVYNACNGMERTHDQMSERAIASNQQIQVELAEKIYEQTGFPQDIWMEIIAKTSDFEEKTRLVANLRATNTLFNKFLLPDRIGFILKRSYSQEALNYFLLQQVILREQYSQVSQVFWMQALLQAGAAVDARDKNQDTPLHWAAENSHVEAMRVLLKAGAAVDAEDEHKRTPLHWAAENGHIEAMRVLLKAGAAVDVEGWLGTPLDSAFIYHRTEAVRLLREYKKD